MSIQVIGDKELVRKLRSLSSAMQAGKTQFALRSGAQIVVNDAKQRAPYLTGNLRRSIHQEDERPGSVIVGTDVVYARRIELGFSDTDRLGRRYNQSPQPYLRPALFGNEDRVVKEVADSLRVLVLAAAS